MRNLKHLTFFAGFITVVLASCSIEKRVHQPGYHVEWHTAQKNVKPLPQLTPDEVIPKQDERGTEVEPPQQVAAANVHSDQQIEGPNEPATASKEVSVLPDGSQRSALENITRDQERRAMTIDPPGTVPVDVEFSEKSNKKFIKSLKKQAKPIGDESQWLRWWLLSWGIAILLTILAVALLSTAIWILAGLAWVAGTVFAIIWLVNVLA